MVMGLDSKAKPWLWVDVGFDIKASIHDDDESSVNELADLVDSYYNNVFSEGEEMENYGLETRREEKRREWRNELEAELAESKSDSDSDRIRVEAELAVGVVGLEGDGRRVRRKVVKWLRARGFDAGLCKSKWDKEEGVQAGSHEYIDVLVKGGSQRYILNLNFPSEFDIARPSPAYVDLLTALPPIFVGNQESLRSIISIMCAAAWASIRSAGMHVPPWRRKEYVQLKWFSSYKRITEGPTLKEENCKHLVATSKMSSLVPSTSHYYT